MAEITRTTGRENQLTDTGVSGFYDKEEKNQHCIFGAGVLVVLSVGAWNLYRLFIPAPIPDDFFVQYKTGGVRKTITISVNNSSPDSGVVILEVGPSIYRPEAGTDSVTRSIPRAKVRRLYDLINEYEVVEWDTSIDDQEAIEGNPAVLVVITNGRKKTIPLTRLANRPKGIDKIPQTMEKIAKHAGINVEESNLIDGIKSDPSDPETH
ncbi:MAG: hypothetical protein ABEJ65_07765 [bacterium]